MEKPHAYCPYCEHDLGEVDPKNVNEDPFDCPNCGKLIKQNKTVMKLFGIIKDEDE